MGSIRPVAPSSFAVKDLEPELDSLKLWARLATAVSVDPSPNSIAIEPAVVELAWDFHWIRNAVILYSAQAFSVPPPNEGVCPDGPKVK